MTTLFIYLFFSRGCEYSVFHQIVLSSIWTVFQLVFWVRFSVLCCGVWLGTMELHMVAFILPCRCKRKDIREHCSR